MFVCVCVIVNVNAIGSCCQLLPLHFPIIKTYHFKRQLFSECTDIVSVHSLAAIAQSSQVSGVVSK